MTEIPEPEMQAILALCSHDWFATGCHPCQFRAAAAVEHLTDLVKRFTDSL